MEKITIEITEQEGDLVMPNYPHQLNASNRKSNGKYDLEILDVDKFREFLNDEIDPHGFGRGNIDRITFRNLKSILSNFYNALFFKYHNNPMDNYELEDDGLTIDDIK